MAPDNIERLKIASALLPFTHSGSESIKRWQS